MHIGKYFTISSQPLGKCLLYIVIIAQSLPFLKRVLPVSINSQHANQFLSGNPDWYSILYIKCLESTY